MADKSPGWAQKIANILMSTPTTGQTQAAPQMGGMAGNAQQLLQSRPYQLHVQEAQAQGMQPMTPEQFQASQGK